MNGKRESRAGILSQFQVRKRKKGNDFTYKLNAFFSIFFQLEFLKIGLTMKG